MPKELNILYTPAQVAEKIDLSQSSIRRYTIALEKSGYTNIKRDPNNHRKYDIYDIQTLEYFKSLVNEKKLSFEMALEQTMNDLDYINSKIDTKGLYNVSTDSQNTEIRQLEEKVDTLIELVRELNYKTEHLQKDNERLTALVEKQPLTLQSPKQEDIDAFEEPNKAYTEQTDSHVGVSSIEDKKTSLGGSEPAKMEEAKNTKKDGIFSHLKKFFR